jgi:hypothetical protein
MFPIDEVNDGTHGRFPSAGYFILDLQNIPKQTSFSIYRLVEN